MRACDRSFSLVCHIHSRASINIGNKSQVEPGFLPNSSGHASKKLKTGDSCDVLQSEKLVVAA